MNESLETPPNLALNKPAMQSSTSKWSAFSDPATDARGANNGEVSNQQGFHTASEMEPWWQTDLQTESLIRKVVIFNRQAHASRLRNFKILKSLNGITWQVIYQKLDDSVFGSRDNLPFVAHIEGGHLARYIRIQLDGFGCLHFNECEVYGEVIDNETREKLIIGHLRAEMERMRHPEGRVGEIVEIDNIVAFVDVESYSEKIIKSLREGWYESRERKIIKKFARPTDRVIEVGTAIGMVAMNAARIVGAGNVLTFDANPDIVADARENFRRNGFIDIKSHWSILKNRKSIGDPNETVDFFVSKSFWASRLDASETDSDILKKVSVPVRCLENEIAMHAANFLICDIEGGEIDLLMDADLTGIDKIIIETHYWAVGKARTDALIRKLIIDGFSIDLEVSADHATYLRRDSHDA